MLPSYRFLNTKTLTVSNTQGLSTTAVLPSSQLGCHLRYISYWGVMKWGYLFCPRFRSYFSVYLLISHILRFSNISQQTAHL